jgi:hypothetical protein
MIEELLDAWPDDSAYSPSIPKPELLQSASCVTKRHSKTRKHRKQKKAPKPEVYRTTDTHTQNLFAEVF